AGTTGARTGAPARPQDHGSRDSQGSARRRAGKKTELAAAIMERSEGRFAMKAVADTLAVARSNLIERVSRRAKSRRPYRKAGDNELLALIRRLVDEGPTYGYRRIRRLINRQRKANGKPPVNGKRVLRIMQANKLTLERHTCSVPECEGIRQTDPAFREALWARYFMAAPRPRTPSELRYSNRRLRSKSLRHSMG